jgi:holo-[acyl-carrier protein] synthase
VIIGMGTDIVSVPRIAALVDGRGHAFLARWFTQGELDYCLTKAQPSRHLAARIAAKEAVFKALQLSGERPVPWLEIEVGHNVVGAPTARLSGDVRREAQRAGTAQILLSISHSDDHATATALALGPQLTAGQDLLE